MPTPNKKRVAIYARVSTFDKGQDPETQLLQLREYAQRRGFDVAGEYVDYATDTTGEVVVSFKVTLFDFPTPRLIL